MNIICYSYTVIVNDEICNGVNCYGPLRPGEVSKTWLRAQRCVCCRNIRPLCRYRVISFNIF